MAASRRAELQRQLRGETPFVAAPDAASGGRRVRATVRRTRTTRIQEAQTRLDDLLLRFTDKHPDVIAARETLEALRTRQKPRRLRRCAWRCGRGGGCRRQSNPVYQTSSCS